MGMRYAFTKGVCERVSEAFWICEMHAVYVSIVQVRK